jgi:hypothetical protein
MEYKVTSLSIPLPIADALGLTAPRISGSSPRQPTTQAVVNRQAESLVAPSKASLDLLPQELERIERATTQINPALACLERQRDSINDQRLLKQALSGYSVLGLWSRAVSWIKWGVRSAYYAPHERINQIEQSISENVSELKRITERVVVPALSDVREEFRGRSFIRDAQTPKALMMISVPSEKVGKVLSFDALRITIDARRPGAETIRELPKGDARIVLERTLSGKKQILEFAYRRPGKVDVYVNGERKGSMWNDDAAEVADAFMLGREIPLEKRARSTEYTVA